MAAKVQKEIELTKKTKEYNLNTSMKNYIDPRVYKEWCDKVGLDWSKLYSKSLLRKLLVGRAQEQDDEEDVTASVPTVKR